MVRIRHIIILLLAAHPKALNAQGGTCTTIANGAFTAPSVWDCGCSPDTCDTLVITSSLTHPSDVLVTGDVHLTPSGALSVAGNLTLTGTVHNEGGLNADVLVLGDSASFTSSSGLLNADRILLKADSSSNSGNITVFDTLRVEAGSRLVNTGSCSGHFLWTSHTMNTGQLVFDRIGADGDVLNSGLIRSTWSMVVFDTLRNNSGYLDTDSLLINGEFLNNTFMNIRTRMYVNTWGTFDTGTTGQAFCNGNFYNYGTVKGNGDLCIAGNSVNYGDITGSPDICDVSLFFNNPPYLVYNLGSVGPNVNWCPSANCSTLGISTPASFDLLISPNPATDRVRIEGLDTRPQDIVLLDVHGRACPVRSTWSSGVLVLERGDLPAVTYLLRLTDRDGRIRHARIVMAGQ